MKFYQIAVTFITSLLNKNIVVHILSPKGMGSGFTNVYLEEVRKISEDVNNRSYNQLKLTPRYSKTSAEPTLLEAERLPCLATFTPPAIAVL